MHNTDLSHWQHNHVSHDTNAHGERSASVVTIVAHDPQPPEYYKVLLQQCTDIRHLTVEINHCS